jgi:hypothetical protein
MINQSFYLKYIFVLLVSAYLIDQLNQFYNFNIFNFANFIGYQGQNILETIFELGISFFSLYILFNFNIQNVLIKFILILFSIFYFLDGIASLMLFVNVNGSRKTVSAINKDIFMTEFFVTKIGTIALFYILYSTLF